MNKSLRWLLVVVVFSACQKSEVVSEFTGNQVTYGLQAGSAYPVSGTVTIKERKDGAVTISLKLSGTSADTKSPVHLHLGDVGTPQAAVAALLSPVLGKSGESETILKKFADETAVSYKGLLQLDACIKVHLSEVGAERDIILVAGNIGAATAKASNGSRLGISVCSSYGF
jgi:hypothetical protein